MAPSRLDPNSTNQSSTSNQPTVKSDSPNLPWTQSGQSYYCNRINSYPSPVITFQLDFHDSKFQCDTKLAGIIAVHVMMDCGANVSFITLSKCRFFGIEKFIIPAGQLALQADGVTQLQVRGELHMVLTRTTSKNETLKFKFDALVVDKLNNCDVIGGQNFLIENHIDLFLKKRKIAVQEKYYFEESPSNLSGPLIPGSSVLADTEDEFSQTKPEVEDLKICQQPKIYPQFCPKQKYQTVPPDLLSLQISPLPTFL